MRKKQFKAESKRLLELMINSIYTNREIFLRELISNASDAIDKLCYLSLTDESIGISREDFAVKLIPDEESRTLTISDNGVGMTQEDLESNLGTIAQSGSKAFKESLEDDDAVNIIGQFGVGFYSAFMVADHVKVVSRAYGSDQAYVWESNGADGYTITEGEREEYGSDIILTLKEDSEDERYSRYLDRVELSALVKKYSDYISWPIKMEMEQHKHVEAEESETVTYLEEETLNSMVPIWQKAKGDVTDEEFDSFYKEKFYDLDAPLATIQVSAEGTVTYKALLFIPEKAPYDYYTKDFQKGLQLYSNGVLIMDKCSDLLPEHFRFVRGVVDSADLSLNISREMLQQSRQVKVIASNLEKKIKSELKKLLENEREKYELFWKSFGIQLKYGILSDFGAHKELLRELLLFNSSNGDSPSTLEEYVGRMPEEQKYIYYASGASLSKITALPQLEKLSEHGYEALYLTESVDEFVMQTLNEQDGKELRSLAGGEDLGLDSDQTAQEQEESRGLTDYLKGVLGDRVSDVRVSDKLKSSPVCLTAGGPLSFEMEKYFQNIGESSPMKAERVLEINLQHPSIKAINDYYERDEERAKKYAEILLGQALIAADLPLDDPAVYSNLIFDLLI